MGGREGERERKEREGEKREKREREKKEEGGHSIMLVGSCW